MHHAIQVWHLGKWVRKAAPWQPLPAHCCESFVQWEAVGFVSAAVGAQCTWWVNAGLAALRDWPSAHCPADGKNGSCLRAQMSLWLMYFNLKTFAECISAFAGILKPNTRKRGKCPSLSIFGITLVRISWKKQSSSDFFFYFLPVVSHTHCRVKSPVLHCFHFSLSFSSLHCSSIRCVS